MIDRRAEITFRGVVQGVGFRWTTARHASREGIFGWVRNEPDGSVRLVVEGRREDIDAFLLALEADFGGQIRSRELDLGVARGEFDCFRILQG